VVAGVVAVLILAVAGFFIYRKRRRTGQNKEQSILQGPYYGYGEHPNNKANYRDVIELSDSQVVELPTGQLSSQDKKPRNQPVELPS